VTDKLRTICRERCAEAGDPPCYRFDDDSGLPFTACSDCLVDAGIPLTEPQDPNAAIRDLF
jgi:hypothetical protein